MGIKQSLYRIAGKLFFERPGKKRTYDEMIFRLKDSDETVKEAIAQGADTEKNRELLAHIIGIERWGQKRLKSFMNGQAPTDEYDGYRPDLSMSVQRLAKEWETTRKKSIKTVKQLQSQDVPTSQVVPHNDFGGLSPGGWVQYLAGHASMEIKRLKK